MRFFREELAGVYEQARITLDAAWGLPDGNGTDTCMCPASKSPRDAHGRIVVALRELFCEWEPANAMLPQLLSSGAVTEITAGDYEAAVDVPMS